MQLLQVEMQFSGEPMIRHSNLILGTKTSVASVLHQLFNYFLSRKLRCDRRKFQVCFYHDLPLTFSIHMDVSYLAIAQFQAFLSIFPLYKSIITNCYS